MAPSPLAKLNPGYWEGSKVPIPDCQIDTAAWVEATDKLTKRRFDPTLPLLGDLHRDQPDSSYDSFINHDVLQEMVDARRVACLRQHSLSRLAVDLFTDRDFEAKWVALGKAGREKHIFAAYRALEANGGPVIMESFYPGKVNCPELIYENLTKNEGRGYIDLLKLYLLDDINVAPTQPFIPPNEMFDKLIGWKEDDKCKNRKAYLGMRRLMRGYHIASFLGIVITSYEGRPIEFVKFTHEHHKTKETLAGVKPIMDQIMGPAAANKWKKEETQKRKEMKLFCSACLKPEEKSEMGKMSACRPCKAIGREVRYCNKECQRNAWKTHKAECGKLLDLEQAFKPVTPFIGRKPRPVRPDIPPVRPGHRRSPHLLRLIQYLNETPLKDYIMVLEGVDELEGVSLDTIQGAALFTIMRNRLMAGWTQDGAMLYVYRVLQRSAAGDVGLRAQLAREYGETWERVWRVEKAGGKHKQVDPVGREEVEKAVMWLKDNGRFKVELRGFVPGVGETQKSAIVVGPKQDVTVVADFPASLMPTAPITIARANISDVSKKTVGPNYDIPKNKNHARNKHIDKQLELLRANPLTDYIIWHPLSKPPYAITFLDPVEACLFIGYRQRLFEYGAHDRGGGGHELDALVFLLMALEPLVRSSGVARNVLYDQLALEYSRECVDEALGSIVWGETREEDEYRRGDGRVFGKKTFPAKHGQVDGIPQGMLAVGRFGPLKPKVK
ncbi:hypothetical protein Hypma_004013 [Hypsizygus marmoreus]|uniref:MYND-type domain-containing protein n=1 Tax=Hypsizygus marmoreus TaxID=39966 RepID=A0A369J4S9_HYPMA|nr:hypothetical protein Hypma_004013 [Hypsizygus marmoreus]